MSKVLQKMALSKKRENVDAAMKKMSKATPRVRGAKEVVKSGSKAVINADLRPVRAIASKEKQIKESSMIYLGHIPYGFFETEMKKFFRQFGEVKRLKLSRSPKTQNSRGFAFIEFENPTIAKVVAEAMNGYFLMERRLICHVVDPEEIHSGKLYSAKKVKKPTKVSAKLTAMEVDDVDISERSAENVQKMLQQHQKDIQKKQKKLAALGFDFQIPFGNFGDIVVLASKPVQPEQVAPVAVAVPLAASTASKSSPAKPAEEVSKSRKGRRVQSAEKQAVVAAASPKAASPKPASPAAKKTNEKKAAAEKKPATDKKATKIGSKPKRR